jgi:hypothetical protein
MLICRVPRDDSQRPALALRLRGGGDYSNLITANAVIYVVNVFL